MIDSLRRSLPVRWRGPFCFAVAATLLAVAWSCSTGTPAAAQPRDRYTDARNRMVDDYIVKEGVKNAAVIKSMRTVPRHLFVKAAMREQA
jgi:hypothetical protein